LRQNNFFKKDTYCCNTTAVSINPDEDGEIVLGYLTGHPDNGLTLLTAMW
jgi:hypothetical protein